MTSPRPIGNNWRRRLVAESAGLVVAATIALCGAVPVQSAEFPGRARLWHAAALHRNTDEILFFGGLITDSLGALRSDETWAYNTRAQSWRRLEPFGVGPLPRYGASVAVDNANGQFYMFSGSVGIPGQDCVNDLWRLDLRSNAWLSEPPIPQALIGRVQGSLTFEPHKRELTALFGYCFDFAFDAAWSFQVQTGEWSVHVPPQDVEPRIGHLAAADTRRGRILVTAGYEPLRAIIPGQENNWRKVWAYYPEDKRWELLSSGAEGPPWVSHPTGGYDEVSDALLLFGGRVVGTRTVSNQLWQFDLKTNSWVRVAQPDSSFRRVGGAGAYCPCEGALAVFGGRSRLSGTDAVHKDLRMLPIQRKVALTWIGASRRDLAAVPRWARVDVAAASDILPEGGGLGQDPSSYVLMDCKSGTVLGGPQLVKFVGQGELLLRFDNLPDTVLAVARAGDLRLTGSEGDGHARWLATVPPWKEAYRGSKVATNAIGRSTAEARVAKYEVRFVPKPHGFGLWLDSEVGVDVTVQVVDVLGRRRFWRRITSVEALRSDEIMAWSGLDNNGRRVAPGVYFAIARIGSQEYKYPCIVR